MGLDSFRKGPFAGLEATVMAIAAAVSPAITACGKATVDECQALLDASDRRGFPFDSDAVRYQPTGDQWTVGFDVPEDELAASCQLPFRAQVRGDVWMIAKGDTEPKLHTDIALSEPVTISDSGAHHLAFNAGKIEDVVSLRVRVQLPNGTTKDTPDELINSTDPLAEDEFPATGEPGEDRNTDRLDDLPDPAGQDDEDLEDPEE